MPEKLKIKTKEKKENRPAVATRISEDDHLILTRQCDFHKILMSDLLNHIVIEYCKKYK